MRWQTSYNLGVLRLISFGMDLHWARAAASVARLAAPSSSSPLSHHPPPLHSATEGAHKGADGDSLKVR